MRFGSFSRLAALALLTVPLVSADAVAKRYHDFEYSEAAKRLMPFMTQNVAGRVATFDEHEDILASAIAFRALTMLDEPLTVSIAGARFTFDTQVPLFMVENYTGADSVTYPSGTKVFCQMKTIRPRDVAKGLPGNEAGKRFEKEGTLCLVDHRNDGTFDQAVMSGIKARELRTSADITLLPYSVDESIRLPDSWAAISFQHRSRLASPRLYVRMALLDRFVQLSDMKIELDDSGARHSVPLTLNIAKDKLPQTHRFGPAQITVLAIDDDAKTIRVRIDSYWGNAPMAATRLYPAY